MLLNSCVHRKHYKPQKTHQNRSFYFDAITVKIFYWIFQQDLGFFTLFSIVLADLNVQRPSILSTKQQFSNLLRARRAISRLIEDTPTTSATIIVCTENISSSRWWHKKWGHDRQYTRLARDRAYSLIQHMMRWHGWLSLLCTGQSFSAPKWSFIIISLYYCRIRLIKNEYFILNMLILGR